MDRVHPLKTYRSEASMTQQQLAELLGVTRTTVARWEAGARVPDVVLLDEIAAKTGIPARELRPDLAKILGGQ